MSLAELKKEYMECLGAILTPSIYDGFKKIFANIKKTHTTGELKEFQLQIKAIAKWTEEQKAEEFARLLTLKNGECITDLIKAIFMTHTKILYSDVSNSRSPTSPRINIVVPNSAVFVHLCYVQAARIFYQNPMLFNEEHNNSDYLNKVKCEEIIKEAINTVIRQSLPIKDILRQYLDEEYQSEPEDTDITDVISKKQIRNIRKLIKNDADEYNLPDDKLRDIIREELKKLMEEQKTSAPPVVPLKAEETKPDTNGISLADNDVVPENKDEPDNVFFTNGDGEENEPSDITIPVEEGNNNNVEDLVFHEDEYKDNTHGDEANNVEGAKVDSNDDHPTVVEKNTNNDIKEIFITTNRKNSVENNRSAVSPPARSETVEVEVEADDVEDIDMSEISEIDSDDDNLNEIDFDTANEDDKPMNETFEFF